MVKKRPKSSRTSGFINSARGRRTFRANFVNLERVSREAARQPAASSYAVPPSGVCKVMSREQESSLEFLLTKERKKEKDERGRAFFSWSPGGYCHNHLRHHRVAARRFQAIRRTFTLDCLFVETRVFLRGRLNPWLTQFAIFVADIWMCKAAGDSFVGNLRPACLLSISRLA